MFKMQAQRSRPGTTVRHLHPVGQVAQQLGYEDMYYFSRLFRQVVGMAPSHYRALHQG